VPGEQQRRDEQRTQHIPRNIRHRLLHIPRTILCRPDGETVQPGGFSRKFTIARLSGGEAPLNER
jgi:hypothetical protein